MEFCLKMTPSAAGWVWEVHSVPCSVFFAVGVAKTEERARLAADMAIKAISFLPDEEDEHGRPERV